MRQYASEPWRDGDEGFAESDLDIDAILLGADAGQPADAEIFSSGDADARPWADGMGARGFDAGLLERSELRVHTGTLLWMKEAAEAIRRRSARLEKVVERRTGELRRMQEEMAAARQATQAAHLDTIRRLVAAAEYKDRDTAAHIERIGHYSELIARVLDLPADEVDTIRDAAPMHDVGKIGVPDAILLKPGTLEPSEWEIMKQHTTIGARILEGSPSRLLRTGAVIALSHHERWDGAGYPNRVAGEEIPLVGRICSVADVFDALTSDRHYRDALPNDTVFEMMAAQRGGQFDPRVLDAFVTRRADVEAIQARQRN
ncbi:MAG: HD domain-containing protein [Gemmatimonadetes bacterium]|nr:HD domain-containing protein [Gemmatimonadota bacterium]